MQFVEFFLKLISIVMLFSSDIQIFHNLLEVVIMSEINFVEMLVIQIYNHNNNDLIIVEIQDIMDQSNQIFQYLMISCCLKTNHQPLSSISGIYYFPSVISISLIALQNLRSVVGVPCQIQPKKKEWSKCGMTRSKAPPRTTKKPSDFRVA